MTSVGNEFLGFEVLTDELITLITTYPPPFIYVNDSTSPRLSASLLSKLLKTTCTSDSEPGPSKRVVYSHVNGVACFTPRLLYDTILNGFTGWTPNWETGCANWTTEAFHDRWNDTFDAFVHGLRVVHRHLQQQHRNHGTEEPEGNGSPKKKGRPKATKKGKGKGTPAEDLKEGGSEELGLVLFIEQADRLKDNLPEFVVPLTRLAEIAMLDISVIMHSHVRWEDIRPPLGASPEPYFIDIPPLTKELIAQRLSQNILSRAPTHDEKPGPYHPSFRHLYSHFITLVVEVAHPFIHDPLEIEYIAAARWPGFVKPVLDDYESKLQSRLQRATMEDGGDAMDIDEEEPEFDENGELLPFRLRPPSESTRLRLSKLFGPSLKQALEELYPRQTNASDWAKANEPPANYLSSSQAQQQQQNLSQYDPSNPFSSPIRRDLIAPANPKKPTIEEDTSELTKCLPRMSKFILVASFLASTNPASSDWRMFGRGLDEKKRKRRIVKTVKTGSGPAKIPQRLLGPTPFLLDRMLAILGALIEDNDGEAQARLDLAGSTDIPSDQWTDMETSRVGVYGTVMGLASMRLLHRTSHPDRLDGPPMFKCGIPYDVVLVLARELTIPVNDLLWDPL